MTSPEVGNLKTLAKRGSQQPGGKGVASKGVAGKTFGEDGERAISRGGTH